MQRKGGKEEKGGNCLLLIFTYLFNTKKSKNKGELPLAGGG
jgi:hypothetical protein